MVKTTLGIIALLVLAGCSGAPRSQFVTESACTAGEATYACQIERYHNVNAQ